MVDAGTEAIKPGNKINAGPSKVQQVKKPVEITEEEERDLEAMMAL